MKKILLLIAVFLPSFLAHSQEADDLGSYAEMSVIPRLDLIPSFSAGNSDFNLGNSSIYTHFRGSFSEHISWTMINKWYTVDTPFTSLFTDLGLSDTSNWLSYCYANFSFGGWTFTLGKQMIDTGGIEAQDYDWESYYGFTTPLWDGLVCSQWGVKAAWTTASELSTFSLQMLASPYGRRPFSSGLWVYSAQWTGKYGWFSPIWSVSAFGREDSSYDMLYSFGQTITFSDEWSLSADYFRNGGFDEDSYLLSGNTVKLRLNYYPSETLTTSLNGIYVQNPLHEYWSVGALANYYPLKDSKDLRLHAQFSYDTLFQQFCLGIGATYSLNIRFGK